MCDCAAGSPARESASQLQGPWHQRFGGMLTGYRIVFTLVHVVVGPATHVVIQFVARYNGGKPAASGCMQ